MSCWSSNVKREIGKKGNFQITKIDQNKTLCVFVLFVHIPQCNTSNSKTQTSNREKAFQRRNKTMSFMRGDFLSRTRKLVKGLAKAQPAWLKAMEQLISLISDSFSSIFVFCILILHFSFAIWESPFWVFITFEKMAPFSVSWFHFLKIHFFYLCLLTPIKGYGCDIHFSGIGLDFTFRV